MPEGVKGGAQIRCIDVDSGNSDALTVTRYLFSSCDYLTVSLVTSNLPYALSGIIDEKFETNRSRKIGTQKTGGPGGGFDLFDCRSFPSQREALAMNAFGIRFGLLFRSRSVGRYRHGSCSFFPRNNAF